MISGIDAVAFDIDGTLYPNAGFYPRLLPFLCKNAGFLARFGVVRREIREWQNSHPGEAHVDFFGWQASLYAAHAGCSVEDARSLIHSKIYEGWKPVFARVRPYAYARDAVLAFREAGLRVGLLSDFLPSQKGDVWGIGPLCDVVLGSEETGALKPSPVPFRVLSDALGVPCSRVLYVGNSIASDVNGASGVGMKTACIQSPVASFLGMRVPGADISFHSYRQLISIVLK
ncbi:MAG: HAD family hydrolase [Treponema sp.]|nr:MAG: HAD family hydrolase [Treponema sp.]